MCLSVHIKVSLCSRYSSTVRLASYVCSYYVFQEYILNSHSNQNEISKKNTHVLEIKSCVLNLWH